MAYSNYRALMVNLIRLLKSILLLAVLLSQLSLVVESKKSKDDLCDKKDGQDCMKSLLHYPLFDTDYKVAANYVPVLPLRALAHAEVYQKKKSAHLERYYYIKDLTGEFDKPYQHLIVDIDIKQRGFIGREIIAKGVLNEFDIYYRNKIGISLPKSAKMDVEAKLEGISILDLKVKSDGQKMTNDVAGSFLGHEVNYHTDWRDTEGILAGIKYKIHSEGVTKEEDKFKAISNGTIGDAQIIGEGHMLMHNFYEFEENYGPILIKTKLKILD